MKSFAFILTAILAGPAWSQDIEYPDLGSLLRKGEAQAAVARQNLDHDKDKDKKEKDDEKAARKAAEQERNEWEKKLKDPSLLTFEDLKLNEPKLDDTTNPPLDASGKAVDIQAFIDRFTRLESKFRRERGDYSYDQLAQYRIFSQSQTNMVTGEWLQQHHVDFTPDGDRLEDSRYDPLPWGSVIGHLDEWDVSDLMTVQPFSLITEDLPKYNVTYVGSVSPKSLHVHKHYTIWHQEDKNVQQEELDSQDVDLETDCYVFKVFPKSIDPNPKVRYFGGYVWVDKNRHLILMTYGKAVPDLMIKKDIHLFPRFYTFQADFGGNWFPYFTMSQDVLRFPGQPTTIHAFVKYYNYERRTSSLKIHGKISDEDNPKPEPQQKPQPEKKP